MFLQRHKTRELAEHIEGLILSGQWPVGYRLPTQRQLAITYGLNRSTIAEALLMLQISGLIETKGRKGSFVSANGWELVASRPRHWASAIGSGFYKSNQPMIQAINQLEFDPSYVRLGTGELSPSLYPKQAMAKVMAEVGQNLDHMGYECPLGYLPLREALSRRLKRWGIQASPDSILITSGSLQGLHLISIGLMDPASTVYTESLSYIYSLNTLHSVGLTLKTIEMDQEGLKVTHLQQALKKDRPKERYLYTIPTYQNPSGMLMSLERRVALMALASQERLPIIEDDAYRELYLDEPPPPPLKSMDHHGNVLYLGTLSKILAPGLRIGWIVGPEPAIARLGDLKMQLDYGASGPSAAIATAWLNTEAYDQNAEGIRMAMRHRRQLCLKLLETHFRDLADWEMPKGGFYIWLKLRKAIPANKLFEEALKMKILLNSGDLYAQAETKALRLSYAYAEESQLSEKLAELATLLKAL